MKTGRTGDTHMTCSVTPVSWYTPNKGGPIDGAR